MQGDNVVPRFMTHCAASRHKFNDAGVRRDITPIQPMILKDQYSDPGMPRALTPKREAMWRNFGGGQAAQLTGLARTAFGDSVKPNIHSDVVVPGAAGRCSTPQPSSLSASLSLPSSFPSSAAAAIAVGTKPDHWTLTKATTLVPTDKNSAVLGGNRADSIVRAAPFPHTKNIVLPLEDPTADTTRKQLWMNKPLRTGQFTATRKRTYDLPGYFRESHEIGELQEEPRAGKHRSVQVQPCLAGAAGQVTEEAHERRLRCQPLRPTEFNPPYNETERVLGGVKQAVPKAAVTLGKMHLAPPVPAGVKDHQMLPGWSAQVVEPRRGRAYHSHENLNPEPKPFRPSIAPMAGAPAIGQATPSSRSNSPSVIMVAGAASARTNSPSRRQLYTPTDSDIFGAKALAVNSSRGLQQPQPVSAPRCLSPAPDTRPRCKGAGAYSPMRRMPEYRF